jgi:hypothetical protein
MPLNLSSTSLPPATAGLVSVGSSGAPRFGEAARLPLDWRRWREYLDADGRPAGERGGFSKSLMIRHFAEKQEEDEQAEGLSFYENTQHVPPMFEEVLVEVLDHVAMITATLRERLRRQADTGRIFPEYPEDALVPAWEMYVRMAVWTLDL